MGKNRPHAIAHSKMYAWLFTVFGGDFLNSDAPIDPAPEDRAIDEPEPDLIVLNRDQSTLVSDNPRPEDLRLVVEISDTSLAFDLNVKAPLYAKANVPEIWVLDVSGRRAIAHREPSAEGYRSVTVYPEHESVAPLAAPDHPFCWATVMAGPARA